MRVVCNRRPCAKQLVGAFRWGRHQIGAIEQRQALPRAAGPQRCSLAQRLDGLWPELRQDLFDRGMAVESRQQALAYPLTDGVVGKDKGIRSVTAGMAACSLSAKLLYGTATASTATSVCCRL